MVKSLVLEILNTSLPNWNPASNSQLMSVGWNLRWQLVESAQIDRPVTLLAQSAKIFHDSEMLYSFLWVFSVILLVIFSWLSSCLPLFYLYYYKYVE